MVSSWLSYAGNPVADNVLLVVLSALDRPDSVSPSLEHVGSCREIESAEVSAVLSEDVVGPRLTPPDGWHWGRAGRPGSRRWIERLGLAVDFHPDPAVEIRLEGAPEGLFGRHGGRRRSGSHHRILPEDVGDLLVILALVRQERYRLDDSLDSDDRPAPRP
jgi:hypothetical protein